MLATAKAPACLFENGTATIPSLDVVADNAMTSAIGLPEITRSIVLTPTIVGAGCPAPQPKIRAPEASARGDADCIAKTKVWLPFGPTETGVLAVPVIAFVAGLVV